MKESKKYLQKEDKFLISICPMSGLKTLLTLRNSPRAYQRIISALDTCSDNNICDLKNPWCIMCINEYDSYISRFQNFLCNSRKGATPILINTIPKLITY